MVVGLLPSGGRAALNSPTRVAEQYTFISISLLVRAQCCSQDVNRLLAYSPMLNRHASQNSQKKIPRPSEPLTESWSMYPELHCDVHRLLRDDHLDFTFFSMDHDDDLTEEYDPNIMGRFACQNDQCPNRGWSSKMVAITIRSYDGQRYNARVYHQRCKKCSVLSKPRLNDSYAERVAYRLKKWSGIQMDLPTYSLRGSERPHQSELCEGCKLGHCRLASI